jgi:hypothetical protein
MQVNFNDGKYLISIENKDLLIDPKIFQECFNKQSDSDLQNDPLPTIEQFTEELENAKLDIWCFTFWYQNSELKSIIFDGNFNNFDYKKSKIWEPDFQRLKFYFEFGLTPRLSFISDLHWNSPDLIISESGYLQLLEDFEFIAKINNLPWFD